MNRKNKLPVGTLLATKNDPVARDQLLVQTYSKGKIGLTLDRLVRIREARGTLYNRLLAAANVFYEALLEIETFPKKDASYQFTRLNLAALVYKHWNNPEQKAEDVGEAIVKRNGGRLRRVRDRYNFVNLSPYQLFREEVKAGNLWLYRGNLYEARDYWKRFQPSDGDFLNNIKIPSNLGFYEALLLGVIWARGNIYPLKSLTSLVIFGHRGDMKFYEYVVAPLVRDVHNYRVSGYTEVIITAKGRHRYEYPRVRIDSQAVCSWLIDDLGFTVTYAKTRDRRRVRIPFKYLKTGDARYGFFAGVLATMGEVSQNGILSISSVNKGLIDDVVRLTEGIGYNPSEAKFEKGRWRIYFPREDLIKMYNTDIDDIADIGSFVSRPAHPHVGLLFNRRHQIMW